MEKLRPSSHVAPERRPLLDRGAFALERLRRDVREGVRSIVKRPLHSVAIITTLALGVGLNAAVFSVVDWVLLRPLPYPSSGELVRVWVSEKQDEVPGTVTYSTIRQTAAAPSIRAVAGFSSVTCIASADGVDPGIQDEFMRRHAIDYFENSRRATYVHQQYAIRNPRRFRDYGELVWGITASNGPGPRTRRLNGVTRSFLGYAARGVPYGPDDGTLAPWAVVASLPFAPEIVLPTLQHCADRYHEENEYGLVCSINPTFPDKGQAWISDDHFALDQGPVVMMIENYRSGLVWRLMRNCPYIVTGLRRAGFTGGWLI